MKESYDRNSWCIVWVGEHATYPTMTSNIADKDIAERMAAYMEEEGKDILCVCSAGDLASMLVPQEA